MLAEIPPRQGVIDMSDIEAKAVKKIGKGFMSVLKGIGEGLEAIAEANARKAEEQAELQRQVDEFNDKWSGSPLVLVPKSQVATPTRRCGMHTAFWDCEDPNCFYHEAEKTRRKVGTPTRDYRD